MSYQGLPLATSVPPYLDLGYGRYPSAYQAFSYYHYWYPQSQGKAGNIYETILTPKIVYQYDFYGQPTACVFGLSRLWYGFVHEGDPVNAGTYHDGLTEYSTDLVIPSLPSGWFLADTFNAFYWFFAPSHQYEVPPSPPYPNMDIPDEGMCASHGLASWYVYHAQFACWGYDGTLSPDAEIIRPGIVNLLAMAILSGLGMIAGALNTGRQPKDH